MESEVVLDRKWKAHDARKLRDAATRQATTITACATVPKNVIQQRYHTPTTTIPRRRQVAAMKLDTKAIRYLTPEDWRVLTAVYDLSSSYTNLRILTEIPGGNGKQKPRTCPHATHPPNLRP